MGAEQHKKEKISKIKASVKSGLENVYLAQEVRSGSIKALSQAITLAESVKSSDIEKAQAVLKELLPHTGNSVRIGISGVPGAGKSTFIEAFGCLLCEAGHKVAVLAVDPSSSVGQGSILGDKTRMNILSAQSNAFVRPSPSSGSLGGVGRSTRESILLCEAAGFDVIIVETVGVGQNETTVRGMVDVFVLLAVAGTGDELQGIKRGITELADIVLVNKADGDNKARAKAARQEIARAFHLQAPRQSAWAPEVALCSALEHTGLKEAWTMIERYVHFTKANGYFFANRNEQLISWLHDLLKDHLWRRFNEHHLVQKAKVETEKAVKNLELPANEAAERLLGLFLGKV
ncbi:MAG: methylmalonyl Co-A mutase-associated GTPase MeaB [Bacteroidia bacterium]